MTIIVTIKGPDAKKALAELVSNVQYDNLKVHITVKEKDNGSEITYPVK